jgi:hypothetical protein
MPDVHLGRHGERHRSGVADGVRRPLYVPLGPTAGAATTILLTETLRISFDTAAVGWDDLVCGTLLLLFTIFLPQGLLGSGLAVLTRREVVRHE